MTEMTDPELEDLTRRYRELIAVQQTLLLSTASANGVPDSSYAPFVRDDAGVFYIYVSKMAGHSANLRTNPQASLLFIRPESESPQLFARERAVLNCDVQEIIRGDALYDDRIQRLQNKFGEIVGVLRTLPDFHLFALHPQTGRYVVGFGRTFGINVMDNAISR